MGRSETFDHTADLGLRIHASDLSDLFRTAAEGLFDVIVANRQAVVGQESVQVDLRADDPVALLVDWLNELVFLSETTHRLFSQFDVHVEPDGTSLQAEIHGEPIDASRHILDHEVKAVTHHRVSIDAENGGLVAEVILDI